jgi:hypothetical protein
MIIGVFEKRRVVVTTFFECMVCYVKHNINVILWSLLLLGEGGGGVDVEK